MLKIIRTHSTTPKRSIHKRYIHAVSFAILLSASVFLMTGCSMDSIYYLFGSDKAIKQEASYQEYSGDNGVSLVYDASTWEDPYMVQDDTISIVTGNSFNYTAVMLQVTDSYDDFLAQSGEELQGETTAIAYDYELTVPNAGTESIRYDCGSYQTIFSVITFDDLTVYLTAATYSGDLTNIETLLTCVYPTGEQNTNAAQLLENTEIP